MSESMMSSFPDNFRIPGQYIYDDRVMLGDYCLPEAVERFRKLHLNDDDIIVASYPKTGTTLLQELVWLICNQADVEKANLTYVYNRVPFVEDASRDNTAIFYALPKPRMLKTHLPFDLLPEDVGKKNVKVVYIYRNPRDTLVSFYHFYRSTKQLGRFPGTWNQFFDLFYRVNKGLLYYGNIFDNIRGYHEQAGDQVLILSFEDVTRNKKSNVCRIADFVNVELNDQQIDKIVEATDFMSMKTKSSTNYNDIPHEIDSKISPFMRKGEIGDWENYFDKEQIEKLESMQREKNLPLQFIYQ